MNIPLKIKVCGMRDEDNICELIDEVEPDFMGLIFYKKSKRLVNKPLSKFCLEKIKKSKTKLIGIFVEQNVEETLEKAQTYQLDAIQLHGGDRHNFEFCKSIKNQHYPVLKVFGVKEKQNISESINQFVPSNTNFNDAANYYLFDTSSSFHGGSGISFNWDLLPNKISHPFFLSGGLSLNNAKEIKKWISSRIEKKYSIPSVLDLNSNFELSPGLKDIKKIKLFINELQG